MEVILFPALAGFGAGFVSSMPIGPINLAIIERCISRRMTGGILVALGATAVDTLYISLALFGLYAYFEKLLQYPVVIRGLQVVGVIILTYLGGKGIWSWYRGQQSLDNMEQEEERADKATTSDFFLGVFLCSSNPFFVLFWVAVAGWFLNTFQTWGFEPAPVSYYTFIAAAVIGDLAWFGLLIVISVWTSQKLGKKFILWVHFALGVLFLACSCYGIYQLTQPLPEKVNPPVVESQ